MRDSHTTEGKGGWIGKWEKQPLEYRDNEWGKGPKGGETRVTGIQKGENQEKR